STPARQRSQKTTRPKSAQRHHARRAGHRAQRSFLIMLCDRHNRVISYLRISVTDRCNFRCVYCLPEDGIEWLPRDEVLRYEEIARVARVGSTLGLTKIRITGGEPTVRKDLPELISLL